MSPPPSPTTQRKRVARGPLRPRYLADRDLDRLMIMFVALMGEVASLRDRLDTHEALADAGRPARTQHVESFEASEERAAKRDELRMATVRRVFRVLMEELHRRDPAAEPAEGPETER